MKATARCRPSVGRKLAECYEVRRNRDDSSNPNASSGVDRCQTRPCKIPVFCRLARLERRLDLGCATRNTTPRSAMHRVAWALQNSKATGQECEKPWENQGFAAERTGTELLGVSPVFLKSSKGTQADDSTCKIDSNRGKTNCDLTPEITDETIGEALWPQP